MRWLPISLALLILAGCGEPVGDPGASRILAMGDSLLAWNRGRGASIADAVERELGEPVTDRSVAGARMHYALPITGAMGLNIARQYRPGPWDWVILNGGGNDLWLGCGCLACDRRIDRLIGPDLTSGTIPAIVARLRRDGARVVITGYMRSPGRGSLIEHCRDEGRVFEDRLARFAGTTPDVHFLSLGAMVPHGDRTFHAFDMIHPSAKGSREIGRRIAGLIRGVEAGAAR